MSKRDAKDAIKKIAKREGKSESEIKEEMEKAIMICFLNKETTHKWDSLFGSRQLPSPQEFRDKMNDAINQAFEENGIVIPKDADLKLTVDPYDFFIHASGVDEELAKRIESALNQGRNGYYLYEHISFCDPVNYGVEEPLQYISGDKEKMVVYHFVNRLTGYKGTGKQGWKVLYSRWRRFVGSAER